LARRPGTIDGVLIDLFGTLVPAGSPAARAPHLHEMAHRLGVDPATFARDWADCIAERCRGEFGSLEETVRRVSERQGARPNVEQVQQATEIRLAFARHTLESCGPVLPELDGLRSAGVRLAVVSDTTAETPRVWAASPLGPRFEATVFSCEEGFCKPDPRMFRLALQRLDLAPERCAFVGDGGSRELTGATSVGLSAYLYNFPGGSPDVEARFEPDTEWTRPPLPDLRNLLDAPR
jgi:putative hydrolase of the HAD superfamily